MKDIAQNNLVRHFAVVDVTDKWSDGYRLSVSKALASGHIPYAFVFCQDKVSILLFNVGMDKLHYCVLKFRTDSFVLCKLDGNEDVEICEEWMSEGMKLKFLRILNCQRQMADLYMPYVESARRIIRSNVESMAKDLHAKGLHASVYDIFSVADDRVGITPWYYRQRLYKGLY